MAATVKAIPAPEHPASAGAGARDVVERCEKLRLSTAAGTQGKAPCRPSRAERSHWSTERAAGRTTARTDIVGGTPADASGRQPPGLPWPPVATGGAVAARGEDDLWDAAVPDS